MTTFMTHTRRCGLTLVGALLVGMSCPAHAQSGSADPRIQRCVDRYGNHVGLLGAIGVTKALAPEPGVSSPRPGVPNGKLVCQFSYIRPNFTIYATDAPKQRTRVDRDCERLWGSNGRRFYFYDRNGEGPSVIDAATQLKIRMPARVKQRCG